MGGGANVGMVDTLTGTFSTILTGLTGSAKYRGGVAVGTNVFFAPYSADNVGMVSC